MNPLTIEHEITYNLCYRTEGVDKLLAILTRPTAGLRRTHQANDATGFGRFQQQRLVPVRVRSSADYPPLVQRRC